MRSVTAPLTELSAADAVMLEAPPVAEGKYERNMLAFISRMLTQCPNVTIIVQPSLRRKSEKATWIQKWNLLQHEPFKFHQTCSCKLGNATPNCHSRYMIGSTMDFTYGACTEIPTLSAANVTVNSSLGGALSSQGSEETLSVQP